MAKLYNWELYDAWCDAAREMGFELESQDGSAIYWTLPDSVQDEFWWILWTPMNAIRKMGSRADRLEDWRYSLNTLRDNEANFHIEAAHKTQFENAYEWFPELNFSNKPVTKDTIKKCAERMLNSENWSKEELLSKLRADWD